MQLSDNQDPHFIHYHGNSEYHKGVIVCNKKTKEWEAKVSNPFNGYHSYPMESLGFYNSVALAKSALQYFYSICIGSKDAHRNYLPNNEERLKIKIAAMELQLQNLGARNLNLHTHIQILEGQNRGFNRLHEQPAENMCCFW